MRKFAVLVSGRGSNLKAIVKAAENGVLPNLPSLVISDNENAPALDFSRERGIETLFIDPSIHKGRKKLGRKIIEELKKREIDTICLAGFMRIIHEDVISEFEGRIVNIHPSLLPDFPGLDVQKKALEAGVKEAGCTVHFVDSGVDTGAIIMQARVPVISGDTVESLSARILEQEHILYPKVLSLLLSDEVRLVGGKAVFEKKRV